MKWTGGPLPDHDAQELPFTAEVLSARKATAPVFKLIQGCDGGTTTRVDPGGAGRCPRAGDPGAGGDPDLDCDRTGDHRRLRRHLKEPAPIEALGHQW